MLWQITPGNCKPHLGAMLAESIEELYVCCRMKAATLGFRLGFYRMTQEFVLHVLQGNVDEENANTLLGFHTGSQGASETYILDSCYCTGVARNNLAARQVCQAGLQGKGSSVGLMANRLSSGLIMVTGFATFPDGAALLMCMKDSQRHHLGPGLPRSTDCRRGLVRFLPGAWLESKQIFP